MKVAQSEAFREGVLEVDDVVEDVVLVEKEVDATVYIAVCAFGRW